MPCETLHFLARPWLLDLCPAGRLHPRGRKFSGFAEFRLAKLGWFAVSQELFSGSWCFLCLIFHDFPLSFHHEIPVVVLENEAVSLPPGNFQKQIRTAASIKMALCHHATTDVWPSESPHKTPNFKTDRLRSRKMVDFFWQSTRKYPQKDSPNMSKSSIPQNSNWNVLKICIFSGCFIVHPGWIIPFSLAESL